MQLHQRIHALCVREKAFLVFFSADFDGVNREYPATNPIGEKWLFNIDNRRCARSLEAGKGDVSGTIQKADAGGAL